MDELEVSKPTALVVQCLVLNRVELKIVRNSNNYVNIALSLSECHQFRKCWTSAATNILAPVSHLLEHEGAWIVWFHANC